MRNSSIIFLIASLCLLPACAKKCEEFKYLDFRQNEFLDVVATDIPDIKGLDDVRPFVTAYRLVRDQYELDVEVYGYLPSVRLSVTDTVKQDVSVVIESSKSANGGFCYSHRQDENDYVITWLENGDCEGSKEIRFKVLSKSDGIIRTENLSFVVVVNGRYCTIDAL